MNVEEHVQYRNEKIENAKIDNPNAWQGKTLEQVLDHVFIDFWHNLPIRRSSGPFPGFYHLFSFISLGT